MGAVVLGAVFFFLVVFLVRVLVVAVAVVLGPALGVEQGVASVVLRDDARRPAWVRFVPAGLAARVDGLSPALPLPATLRLVLARRALAAWNFDLAAAHVARLPASRDRAELRGELAEHAGDTKASVEDFLEAGDLDDIQHRAESLAASGRGDEALELERAAIERAERDPAQAGNLPEAYYRLGLLEQQLAYRIPDIAARAAPQTKSLADYIKAVELAPLEERYLIAAGNEEIDIGDLDSAPGYFRRALDADPGSADALAGLGDVAAREGRKAEAESYLAAARKRDPSSPAVLRLARQIGG